MQLAIDNGTAEKSGDVKTTGFAIGDNAVIASILRSKIYSNPIKTIVQELVSNARDAHREVGKGHIPIAVYLPSSIESVFTVRDFGPGITPDRMDNIFVKYGASTKRDDNVQTGGFGLGAKSPFSYSDTFSIVTYISDEAGKMVKRQYVAYLDESEMGSLSLMSESFEDAPQGTDISVPVKIEDINRFSTALVEVTKHWSVRPTLSRGRVEYPDPEKIIIDNDLWQVRAAYSWNAPITALVDEIPYPVANKHMPKTNGLHNISVFLKFNAGEMPVTANREELDYQDFVIERLESLDELFVAEFIESLKLNLESDNTYPKIYNKLIALISTANTYNVNDLGEWLGINLADFSRYVGDGNFYQVPDSNIRRRRTVSRLYASLRSVDPSTMFFLNDTGLKDPRSLIKYIHDTYKVSAAICELPDPADARYNRIVEYQKLLARAEVGKLSTLATDAKVAKSSKIRVAKKAKKERVSIRKLNLSSASYRAIPYWEQVDYEVEELKDLEGVYVTNYRDGAYSLATLQLIHQALNGKALYSIPKELSNKLDKSKLLLFEDLYKEMMLEIESDSVLFKAIADHLSVISDYNLSGINNTMILLAEYLADTAVPARVIAEMAVKADEVGNKAELYKAGLYTLNLSNKSNKWKEVATLATELNKLCEDHPILDRVSNHTSMYEEAVDLLKDLRFYLVEKHNRRVCDELFESRNNEQVDNDNSSRRETDNGYISNDSVRQSEVVAEPASV